SVLDTTVYSLMQRFVTLIQSWDESGYVHSVTVIHFIEHPLFKPFRADIPANFLSVRDHLYWDLNSQWIDMPLPWKLLLGPCQEASQLLDRCMQLLEIVYQEAEEDLDRA